MRIVHVVTILTPDCSFGGPVIVAMNQVRALKERGHEVVLAGAASGYPQIPSSIDGVPLQLYPAQQVIPGISVSGLRARGLGAYLRSNVGDVDVLHVHLLRDFVTLPAARWGIRNGVPVVLQCHGMVDPSERLLAKPLDLLWTRPTLRRASRVLYLTARERKRLIDLAGSGLTLEELHNGVPLEPVTAYSASHTSAGALHGAAVHDGSKRLCDRPEVLFLARLHPQKRPKLFAEVAVELLKSGAPADFTVIGPDGGEAVEVDGVIGSLPEGLRGRLRRLPAIPSDQVARRIAEAAVYVLPSINETFPMSALEAMSAGRPVILTEDCGLAPVVRNYDCGIVVDETRAELSSAINDLLVDPMRAAQMGERGRRAIENEYSMDSVVDKLEAVYHEAIEASGRICGAR